MFCTLCAADNPAASPSCVGCGADLADGSISRALPARSTPSPAETGDGRGADATPRLVTRPRRRPDGRARRAVRWAMLILPVVAALGTAGTVAALYRADQAEQAGWYATAEAAEAAGRSGEAAGAFAAAGGYRDADARRAAILGPHAAAVDAAAAALDAGRYDEAIGLLTPAVAAVPDDAEAALLLEQARAARVADLTRLVASGELTGDWLTVERALVGLLAERPADAALAARLADVRRHHAPLVYARGDALYLGSPDRQDERLVTNAVPVAYPAWSPDRGRIAFVSPDTSQGERFAGSLYVVDVDGTGLTELARRVLRSRWPVWSPDGDRIAYTSVADLDTSGGTFQGTVSTRVVEVATGRETDLTGALTPYSGSVSWSPSGDRVAVVTRETNASSSGLELLDAEIWTIRLADGAPTNLSQGRLPDAWRLVWSPTDERLIVQTTTESGAYGPDSTALFRLDATTGGIAAIETVSDTATLPVWSPDGSRYAYVVDQSTVRIGGEPGRTVPGSGEVTIEIASALDEALTWSPDGTALLAVAAEPWQPSYLIALDALGETPPTAVSFDTDWASGGPPQWTARNPQPPVAPPVLAPAPTDAAARPGV